MSCRPVCVGHGSHSGAGWSRPGSFSRESRARCPSLRLRKPTSMRRIVAGASGSSRSPIRIPRSCHSTAASAGMMYGATTVLAAGRAAERAAVVILAGAWPVLTYRAGGGRAPERLLLPCLDAEHVGFAAYAAAQRLELGVGRRDALACDEQVEPVTGLRCRTPYRAVRAHRLDTPSKSVPFVRHSARSRGPCAPCLRPAP